MRVAEAEAEADSEADRLSEALWLTLADEDSSTELEIVDVAKAESELDWLSEIV